MLPHLVGSFTLGFLPALGGLVWTFAKLTEAGSRARWGAREFANSELPTLNGRRR